MTDNPDYRLYLEERFDGIGKLINAQFQDVHARLEGIEKQTIKTNGTVLEHAKIIAANIPHSIVNCPQNDIIQDIRDNLIGKKAISRTEKELRAERRERRNQVIKTLSFIVAALALCVTAYFGYINSQKNDKTIQQVENLGEPMVVNKSGKPIDSRGLEIKMYGVKKDTIK